jgi:hypothetical protein
VILSQTPIITGQVPTDGLPSLESTAHDVRSNRKNCRTSLHFFTLRSSPYINNTSLPIVFPTFFEFGPIDASLYGTIGADQEEESRRIIKKIDAP